jgi:arginine deiminase
MQKGIEYGCDNPGRLKSVLIHTPGEELKLINKSNYKEWLFDQVPEINNFVEEHLRYQQLLASNGVKIYELSDYVKINKNLLSSMPNLTYLHDIAVISQKGAILSRMSHPARENEEVVVKEALQNLGIPILIEFLNPNDYFEGCLLLSEHTILVANTERHNIITIKKFIKIILKDFDEVIFVDIPKTRRFMHPDTIFNRISSDLGLVYSPIFKETYLYKNDTKEKIDFIKFMEKRGTELIDVSDSEQKRLACSFVPLDDGTIIHYDISLNKTTQDLLKRKGVEIIFFHPEALLAGGGSLRCITLRLHRE